MSPNPGGLVLGLAVAAQVTLPQFLSPHGGDSRSGGHLAPQGRVPSSHGCCLSGCPRRRGLIVSPQVASRNASASLPRHHKHPGMALAPWGHTGFGDTHGLGTRTAMVLHGEVTRPSWGHVAEGFVPQGTVCDTGTTCGWGVAQHPCPHGAATPNTHSPPPGHQFATSSSQFRGAQTTHGARGGGSRWPPHCLQHKDAPREPPVLVSPKCQSLARLARSCWGGDRAPPHPIGGGLWGRPRCALQIRDMQMSPGSSYKSGAEPAPHRTSGVGGPAAPRQVGASSRGTPLCSWGGTRGGR